METTLDDVSSLQRMHISHTVNVDHAMPKSTSSGDPGGGGAVREGRKGKEGRKGDREI